MALVHSVDDLSVGKVAGRIDTLLTRNYKMQYDSKGRPVMHVVSVACIDSPIRCFPHEPGKKLFNSASPGLTYLLPRNHWAYMWMALNDGLTESNSPDKVKQRKGQLINLCNSKWLDSVRVRYLKHLHAKCIDEL